MDRHSSSSNASSTMRLRVFPLSFAVHRCYGQGISDTMKRGDVSLGSLLSRAE